MADNYIHSLPESIAMNRRHALTAISGIALATSGLAITTRESNAMDVEIDGLDVPDKSRDVSNPVSAVQLQVDGQYQYETSVSPTRLVLRLEVRPTGGEWSQLDSILKQDGLTTSESADYTLQGNVVNHPEISASEFTPAERGESQTVDVDVRVRMSMSNEGEKLGGQQVKDTVSITVARTPASVELSVGGTGSVGITTTS